MSFYILRNLFSDHIKPEVNHSTSGFRYKLFPYLHTNQGDVYSTIGERSLWFDMNLIIKQTISLRINSDDERIVSKIYDLSMIKTKDNIQNYTDIELTLIIGRELLDHNLLKDFIHKDEIIEYFKD